MSKELSPQEQAYLQGFAAKCAEYGVDPAQLIKAAQAGLLQGAGVAGEGATRTGLAGAWPRFLNKAILGGDKAAPVNYGKLPMPMPNKDVTLGNKATPGMITAGTRNF